MQPESHSTDTTEDDPKMILAWIPKNRMKRPIPLMWGLAALALFVIFAVITQVQFSRIADDKIYAARLDTWESDIRAYDVSVTAYEACVGAVGTRDTYRGLFGGVATLFQLSADLPVALFPDSEVALSYQETLTDNIKSLLTVPVEDKLQPKDVNDCEKPPANEPARPEK